MQPAGSQADRTVTPAEAAAPGPATEGDGPVWHTLSAQQVLQAQQVDGQRGLSAADVASRAQRFGLNKFAEAKTESRWRAFVRQYADPMQIVLLVAGIVSLYPVKELETGLVLILLTLFNAVLGLRPGQAGGGCLGWPGHAAPARVTTPNWRGFPPVVASRAPVTSALPVMAHSPLAGWW